MSLRSPDYHKHKKMLTTREYKPVESCRKLITIKSHGIHLNCLFKFRIQFLRSYYIVCFCYFLHSCLPIFTCRKICLVYFSTKVIVVSFLLLMVLICEQFVDHFFKCQFGAFLFILNIFILKKKQTNRKCKF